MITKVLRKVNDYKFTKEVLLVLVLAICLAPFLLNIAGFNFSSKGKHFAELHDIVDIYGENNQHHKVTDILHYTLSGSFVHTILEWSAFCAAIFIVILAFTHFSIKKDVATPVIGVALFCSGCMDAFHTLAADRLIDAIADNRDLIPFTWAICRLFNALIMIVGVGIFLTERFKNNTYGFKFVIIISILFGTIAYGIIDVCANSELLPKTTFPDSIITRPWDVLPLLLYVFMGLYLFPKFYRSLPNIFTYTLIISVIPNIAVQIHMAFGSTALFDNHFNIGHFLKIIAYVVPFFGLVLAYKQTYDEAKEAKERLEQAKDSLKKYAKTLEDSNQALDDAVKEAEAASRSKSEFLASMSHEIRTPMNAIIGTADLLNYTDLSQNQKEYINILKNAGEHLLHLLNDILDMAKIESGKMELEYTDFNLYELVETTCELLAMRAHDKHLEMIHHIKKGVPHYVKGDPGRLRQIIVNLIGNSVKFTEKGEIVFKVETEREFDNRAIFRFSVSDTGIGIPDDKKKTIFESFTQADSSITRKHGGTGLGLSISNQLVHIMGGQMKLEDNVPIGSVFSFTINLEKSDKRPKEKLHVKVPELIGTKVLIVDDNAVNRLILKEMVTTWGLSALEAYDGYSAIREIKSAIDFNQPFELILLDCRMPEMDGFSVANIVREELLLKYLIIIMLTSDSFEIVNCKDTKSGIDECLTKPVKMSSLFNVISKCLMEYSHSIDYYENKEYNLPQEISKCKKSKNTLHILLAEDDRMNQVMATNILKLQNHTLEIANNGLEAIEMFNTGRFDIILMDVNMPNMDGMTATREIRTIEEKTGGHIPIVAMTALAFKEDREKCLASGMDAYMSKPIKIAELHTLLEQFYSIDCETEKQKDTSQDNTDTITYDIFNKDDAIEINANSKELLKEMAMIFISDYSQYMFDIENAFNEQNVEGLKKASHKLKGAVANLGENSTYYAALCLEKDSENEEWQNIEQLYNTLTIEAEKLKNALNEYVEGANS